MISVLVPYRPDGGDRDRAWGWISQRWDACFGEEIEVIVESGPDGAHPGEFNHPKAINDAAALASGDVFIVADADTAFDPTWVRVAAQLVQEGRAPWVLPFGYRKLTREATERVLPELPTAPLANCETEWVGQAVNWSGLVVVSRQGFEEVGGYDERIAWWGGDDICFGLTMDALVGKHRRLPGAAFHFWHPQPAEETYGHERHARQQELVDRYIAAAEDPEALREVRFG